MNRVLMIIAAVFLLTSCVRAEDVLSQQAAMLETDRLIEQLPYEAKPFMEGISPTTQPDLRTSIQRILSKAVMGCGETLQCAAKTAFSLIGIVLITTVVSSIVPSGAHWACTMAGALGIGLCFAGDFKSMISLGRETAESLSVFCKLLLPILAGATAATGAFSASAALQTTAVLSMQLFSSCISRVLVPLVFWYLSLAIVGCVQVNPVLAQLGKFTGTFLKKSLRILLFVFSGFLSLTGVISGSADALSVKAAKMAVSAAVPVVGSMVADASETVLISAKLLRNSVGVFGMLAVLSIMIAPFLRLGIHYLVLQVTELICAAVGGKNTGSLLNAISSAMGFILAMVGCSGIMAFIACVCFMKVTLP